MLAIVWGFGIVARLAIVTGFALGFISPVEPVYSPGCHAGMNREARLDRLVHADPSQWMLGSVGNGKVRKPSGIKNSTSAPAYRHRRQETGRLRTTTFT